MIFRRSRAGMDSMETTDPTDSTDVPVHPGDRLLILPRESRLGIRQAIVEVRQAMGPSTVIDGKRVSGIPGWLEALDHMLR